MNGANGYLCLGLYRITLNKFLCSCIALLCFCVSSFAQETESAQSRHIIELQFGINQIKEENLHPKVSTGTLTELSYGFEKRKKVLHQFHFALGYSRLKTELEDLSKTINLRLNTGYSWNYPLVQKNKFKYYLGPEASIAYSICFFPNWDDSHLYWATNYSIGARNSFSVQLKNENEWVAFVSLPLFSIFSRPEIYRLYKIDDTDFGGILSNMNSNLAPAHLTNVFFVKFQTEYRFPVFKNKQQAFTFSTDYARVKHNDSNPFSQLSYQIGIKLLL